MFGMEFMANLTLWVLLDKHGALALAELQSALDEARETAKNTAGAGFWTI